VYSDIVLEHETRFWNEGPGTCCLSCGAWPSVVNYLDVSNTLYCSSFLKLFSSLLWELDWKLFREILVKIPQCRFTDQVQSEELEGNFLQLPDRACSGRTGAPAGRDWGAVANMRPSRRSVEVGKLLSPICWAQEVQQPLSASRSSRRRSALRLRPTSTAPTTKSTRTSRGW